MAEQTLLTRDFTLETLVALRHDVERCAVREGLIDLALYRFVVAVNELTTNAVRHGGGQGRLVLWRTGDQLHCRVTDHGPGLPVSYQPAMPSADAIGGRGLLLASHGVERLTVDGTSVTASTRLR
jgi:anti-sigma regulatory factor (Ser/Thr protein kinase)